MENGYITSSIKTIAYDKSFKTLSAAKRYAEKKGKKVEVVSHNCYVVF